MIFRVLPLSSLLILFVMNLDVSRSYCGLFIALHYENLSMQYTEIFLALQIENFQLKIFDTFLIFAQNIDCGYTLEPPRRGGSNEYPQSMFWSKNKKNRYTPAAMIPQFYYIKVGFEGYTLHRHVFLMY